jgi:hypothetical protein
MAERPLLIFPEPKIAEREKKSTPISSKPLNFPGFQIHKDRLTPQFESMIKSFITDSTQGIEPEYVLVLETLGQIEEFARAVRAVKGLEWLAEIDTDDILPDNLYYQKAKINKTLFSQKIPAIDTSRSKTFWNILKDNLFIDDKGIVLNEAIEGFKDFLPEEFSAHTESIIKALDETIRESKINTISGRLFLSMSNRQAMEELERLWKSWKAPDRRFNRGYGKWKEIFLHLKSLRRWDVEDRIEETGVKGYWKEELDLKRGTASKIAFEIELWYRRTPKKREEVQKQIERLIKEERGNVITSCVIDPIRFHAIKAELPPDGIEKVLKHQYAQLFKNDYIMFFRPLGQFTVEMYHEGVDGHFEKGNVSGDPVAAILDGYPLANHELLQDRLIIDDPDDFESNYLAGERQHGTAMASLVCHGELDAAEPPLNRPIYFRPIMKPVDRGSSRRVEQIPDDLFLEDIIERSVRRIFEGDGNEPAASPTVKVINLSIGDPAQMFFNRLSASARLLDWLAYRYNVLFCVSAGNFLHELDLGKNDIQLKNLENNELIRHTLSIIHQSNRNRRILSPAESVNALTVGALHTDHSTPGYPGNRVDIIPSRSLPSPVSPQGYGFRNSIKPEIHMPGGRQLYNNIQSTIYQIAQDSKFSPGQKVASASFTAGKVNEYVYKTGTSNAAALATRGAALLYNVLEELRGKEGSSIPDENIAVLLKTLLVHGASWGEGTKIMKEFFSNRVEPLQLKKSISRYFGYGVPDIQRVLECTSRRATAIGYGIIGKDEKHEFRFPLPPCLDGLHEIRRLIITLAWFSPINPDSRKYRNAGLSFSPPKDKLRVERQEAQWQIVKNGTVQHEILEGGKAISFQDGEQLAIHVICREDAGSLDDEIHYGLAVTLEVSENIDIPLYEEIRERIRIPIRIEE